MARELPVEAVRRAAISAVSLLGRIKRSKAVKPSATNNSRNPSTLVARDAFVTADVVGLLRTIEAILPSGRLAQITNSVIRAVAVYVVDLVFGPLTVNKQPGQTVGKKVPIEARYFDVPVSVFSTSYFSNPASGNAGPDVWPVSPLKNASVRIVSKTPHQQRPRDRLAAVRVMCNAWSNHCDPLMVLGQKPGSALQRVPGFAIMPQLSAGA